jgi:hypothetical protein
VAQAELDKITAAGIETGRSYVLGDGWSCT